MFIGFDDIVFMIGCSPGYSSMDDSVRFAHFDFLVNRVKSLKSDPSEKVRAV